MNYPLNEQFFNDEDEDVDVDVDVDVDLDLDVDVDVDLDLDVDVNVDEMYYSTKNVLRISLVKYDVKEL